jgi:hypothetical protein
LDVCRARPETTHNLPELGESLLRQPTSGRRLLIVSKWRITQNSPAVAAQFADRWATAASAQARRIEYPDDPFERVPDCFQQVNALHNVLKAAEMAKRTIGSTAAKRRIQQAADAFLAEIVVNTTERNHNDALALARNVLQHFDEYYCGKGRHQTTKSAGGSGLDTEELARSHTVDFGGPSAARPHLLIGPHGGRPIVSIDLVVKAPAAARRLANAVGGAVGAERSAAGEPA